MQLIILDRDGVINEDSDDYIKSPEEWIPINGSLKAIAKLNASGYKVAIATNQSGIARGYYTLSTLEAMHQKMQRLLAQYNGKIDYIAFCPHKPDDHCQCRKPKIGMLTEIMDYFSVTPQQTLFIGDTFSDLKAAQHAHAAFVLVRTGKGNKTLKTSNIDKCNIPVYSNLSAYVDHL
ncbi:MAG: D-glycero-beta-D-manno-heptose 1,7-bisphosphate 7-phosphatase [Endozoicomonadaceae bacterium]|nr:D-glycero-beta-D-manno-heptose 1,7-bisphosphate 7-phosphatase [Endozoicomonadaceae bacterium]